MFISKFCQLGARAARSPAVRGMLVALSVNAYLDFQTLCNLLQIVRDAMCCSMKWLANWLYVCFLR